MTIPKPPKFQQISWQSVTVPNLWPPLEQRLQCEPNLIRHHKFIWKRWYECRKRFSQNVQLTAHQRIWPEDKSKGICYFHGSQNYLLRSVKSDCFADLAPSCISSARTPNGLLSEMPVLLRTIRFLTFLLISLPCRYQMQARPKAGLWN